MAAYVSTTVGEETSLCCFFKNGRLGHVIVRKPFLADRQTDKQTDQSLRQNF